MIDILSNLYGERIIEIQTHLQIPGDEYMVYIFGMNDSPVVVGHGKKIRSKLICDDLTQITKGHIKAFFVRCCLLYGEGPFDRLVIRCQNKQEALQTESVVHGLIGGNVLQLPPEVEDQLFQDIEPGSKSDMVLRMAMASSFSAISDLLKWDRLGLLSQDVKDVIGQKLAINFE